MEAQRYRLRSTVRSTSTSRSSAVDTPGSGRRSPCASATPRSPWRFSRHARSVTGRAAGTVASCTATGRRWPTLRAVLGDGGALQLAHASSRIIPAVRAFAEARGEDVWLREAGLLKVAATEAEDPAVEPLRPRGDRAGSRGGGPMHSTKPTCAGSPTRRGFAWACSSATVRPSNRRGSCLRCGGRPSPRASSSSSEHR